MKKQVKVILSVIMALLAAVLAYIYILVPVSLSAYTVSETTASIYFTEKGYVKDPAFTEVYTVSGGKVLSVMVSEGEYINKGDTICTIDTESLDFEVARLESIIKSYKAQIENIDSEEAMRIQSLKADRASLTGEYDALTAQQNSSSLAQNDRTKLKDEQLRLQNILIEQNKKDVNVLEGDLNKAFQLYEAGSISKSDLDSVENKLSQSKSVLESSIQQLKVIENSAAEADADEYYTAMKSAVSARIAGINDSLSSSYTDAMKSYYTALIEESSSNIDKIKYQISEAVVKSPASGTIESLYADNVNALAPLALIASVSNENEKEIEVFVSTKDAGEIKEGDVVSIILKRQPNDIEFDGVIKKNKRSCRAAGICAWHRGKKG